MFLMRKRFLKNEAQCEACQNKLNFVKYKKASDGFAWRCNERNCNEFQKYTSIRKGSFFENFSIELGIILRVLIKYSTRQQRFTIKNGSEINSKTIDKIIKKLVYKMREPDFSNSKIGGHGVIVQIDETMLNFKVKSHRGRSSTNKTNSLFIVEFDNHITKCFAKIIPDKKESSLVPIICSQVASNSIIWKNEHRSYSNLSEFRLSIIRFATNMSLLQIKELILKLSNPFIMNLNLK